MFTKTFILGLICSTAFTLQAEELTTEQRLEKMEAALANMQQKLQQKDGDIRKLRKEVTQNDAYQRQLSKDLQRRVLQYREQSSTTALDKAFKKMGDDVNLYSVISFVGGTSNVRDADLQKFQGGAHDPNKRGFTLAQAEIGIWGQVDKMFDYRFTGVITDDEGFELEEAWAGISLFNDKAYLRGGYFLTPFGLSNGIHPHAWKWIDQNIMNSRIFGGEGMRGAGAEISFRTALPWQNKLSLYVQNGNDELMQSFRGEGHSHGEDEEHGEEEHFEEAAVGNRPYGEDRDTRSMPDFVIGGRWTHLLIHDDSQLLQLGFSGMFGNNITNGNTFIWGTDFLYTLTDDELNKPRFSLEGEFMMRRYKAGAASIVDEDDPADNFSLPGTTLRDYGLTLQAVYNIDTHWGLGVRGEYVSGSGDSFEGDETVKREADFNRSDRYRISPMVTYSPSNNSRLRLQYNWDRSDYGAGEGSDSSAHTVWLGFEMMLGRHPTRNGLSGSLCQGCGYEHLKPQ